MARSSLVVLITGASGFLGSAATLKVLEAGYQVLLVIRDENQIPWLKQVFGHEEQVRFAVVPDFLKRGAFDEVVKGVDYVLHTASPIPRPEMTKPWKENYIDPAVIGTEEILESATHEPRIKKIVITSSAITFVPLNREDLGPDRTINESLPPAQIDPNADFGFPFMAYCASKTLADTATTKFRSSRKPHYAIVTLHPDYTFGAVPTFKDSTTVNTHPTTTAIVWRELNGIQELLRYQEKEHSVHIDDVAEAHVKALSDGIKDGEKYLLSAGEFTWDDLLAYAQKTYPDMGFKLAEIEPWKEAIKATYFKIDGSKAERELGIKYKPIEVQFKDLADQQIALSKMERAP